MHRRKILQLLDSYQLTGEADRLQWERVRRFVEQNPRCFERELAIGHLTGSAWIVSPGRDHVLLTHHRQVDRWLQLGGHADGDPDILAVACREAAEESGLTRIRPLSTEIFDLDVHPIPARPSTPEHYHYDVRFIFEADPAEPLVISPESKDLARAPLVPLEALTKWAVEEGILRMAVKTRRFKRD